MKVETADTVEVLAGPKVSGLESLAMSFLLSSLLSRATGQQGKEDSNAASRSSLPITALRPPQVQASPNNTEVIALLRRM